jgi:glycosyltransferase involved in cell wall biosynthesis
MNKHTVRAFFYHLKHGKLSFAGHPVFFLWVHLELIFERIFDAFAGETFQTGLVDAQLTAVIKTFERPGALKRLVKSIRRFYPNMHVIVVDDSRVPSKIVGVETIVMPFDSGVSAGRNRALEHVETPFLLLLDDDYVFYRKTVLEPALEQMRKHDEIDIMGGGVVNLPFYGQVEYLDKGLYPTGQSACRPPGSRIGGFRVQDKVANFYIARTDSIRKVGWDDRLKRLDHADFFSRAKGKLITVFNPGFKVLHAQTPYSRAYMRFRNDFGADRALLAEKYGGG